MLLVGWDNLQRLLSACYPAAAWWPPLQYEGTFLPNSWAARACDACRNSLHLRTPVFHATGDPHRFPTCLFCLQSSAVIHIHVHGGKDDSKPSTDQSAEGAGGAVVLHAEQRRRVLARAAAAAEGPAGGGLGLARPDNYKASAAGMIYACSSSPWLINDMMRAGWRAGSASTVLRRRHSARLLWSSGMATHAPACIASEPFTCPAAQVMSWPGEPWAAARAAAASAAGNGDYPPEAGPGVFIYFQPLGG